MNETKGNSSLLKLLRNPDLVVAVGLIGILVLMVVPLPSFVIDIFLTISLAFSLVLLLTATYAKKPLDFSVFPSLLLTLTLFRLALNLASTRLVLLDGPDRGTAAAGVIIESFGEFVVGGNYAVGLVIFIILVIINFVVITKGAGRVAEVAARFTLDAMPGKQMAIDADLNAGVINEAEARKRRSAIAQEADFYGAMDGASKFVRGDAIAGILVVLVNIIGGIIIGTIQKGMGIGDAAETFVLLTVGDGLVSQIPALIISTAAGLVVTRAGSGNNLTEEMGQQLTNHPKAIGVVSASMGVIALIPGMPALPFLTISAGLGYLAWYLSKRTKEKEQADLVATKEKSKESSDKIESLLPMDILELEVGYGLISIVDPDQNGELLTRINQIRRQFALDMGVIIPSLRIRDNLQLNPGQYNFLLKGVSVGGGELMIDHLLAMDPGNIVEPVSGVATTEPAFGLPAIWISPSSKDDAVINGYTVVDLATVMATHLTEILKKHLPELFGRQELQTLLDGFKEQYPKLVEDLIPNLVSPALLLKIMQNLLREQVPIRDLRSILEALLEESANTKDAIYLTEAARSALHRSIASRLLTTGAELPILTLERQIEETIANSIINSERGQELSADPEFVRKLLGSLNMDVARALEQHSQAVVLCSPSIRFHFRRLIERFIPGLVVLSHNEIASNINLKSIGVVRLEDAS
ncbi:MAG: flagellar biosynthesis protein FlhA [Oligoflexia bacterium]|nr:flagellar biosynthesis protein FlhA [Oligoflexia bacterium]